MKRVMVTGASGAFGRAVVARLKAHPEYTVITAGRQHCDYYFDLCDDVDLAPLIDKASPDLILHLAAHFSGTVDEAYSLTVAPTRRLLDAVQRRDCLTRVVLIGSAAEYGAVLSKENPIGVDHALRPVSAYGLGKAWQSELAAVYAAQGVDVIIARVFNLDGDSMPERLFVGRIQRQIAQVQAGQRAAVEVGPLTAVRDYVHVDEAAEQLLAIAERGRSGGVYHIASGRPTQMSEVLHKQLARHGLADISVSSASSLSNRSGLDVPVIYADVLSTRQLMEGHREIRLTVVAPVFNEEQVIAHFHERTRKVLDSMPGVTATLLYVVDRCTDSSLEILRGIAMKSHGTQVIALSSRFGHQMSLLAGIENALDADVIVMMDSDLQHPPELIPELLRKHREGFDVVYTLRRDTESAGFLRQKIGNLFYFGLGKISEAPVNPNAADFRLISKRVARCLSMEFRERNMFLRGLFSWIGFSQCGIEYVAEKRFAGNSKYSLSRMFKLASAGILSSSTKPLQLSIVLGSAFAGFAFLMLLISIIQYFLQSSTPSGWTTLVVLLLLFSGIQLIVIGIVGAYVGGIYEEVKSRPRYIIDERFGND
jgi:nucleoside-diphosphate-sugar epimerase/glycosyltransferase involved in cell wall biosynthesis